MYQNVEKKHIFTWCNIDGLLRPSGKVCLSPKAPFWTEFLNNLPYYLKHCIANIYADDSNVIACGKCKIETEYKLQMPVSSRRPNILKARKTQLSGFYQTLSYLSFIVLIKEN